MEYFFSKNKVSVILLFVVAFIFVFAFLSIAPSDFPKEPFTFKVESGSSISKVADSLYTKHIIKNQNIFKIFVIALSLNDGLKTGDYKFLGSESVITIAHRMVTGDQRQPRVRITIPEGMNVSDMAFVFLKNLDNFNAPHFVSIAKKKEGYLYPDTYDFFANAKSEDIVKAMEGNFNKKIAGLSSKIKAFNKPLKDIITMASIVEKEANTMEDRKMISGVLWKRIEEGMLLQVDPPFYYILNKTGGITFDDLKIKSPYNTYINKGLPIGPINNPGIEAIEATISPVKTNYYFYLSGRDGKMYYAATYAGHLANKSKYLDK